MSSEDASRKRRRRQWDVDNTGNVIQNTPAHALLSVMPNVNAGSSSNLNQLSFSGQLEGKQSAEGKDQKKTHDVGASTKETVLVTDEDYLTAPLAKELYAHGHYYKKVEINESRNRYAVTKKEIQDKIQEQTGASLATRGKYYPSSAMAHNEKEPPLYLYVSGESEQGVRDALLLIKNYLLPPQPPPLSSVNASDAIATSGSLLGNPPLPSAITNNPTMPSLIRKPLVMMMSGKPVYYDKVSVGIPLTDQPVAFNIKGKLVGHGGVNMKHICTQTNSKVQIKGLGSGFIETSTGVESPEPIFLHITNPTVEGLEAAKQLCKDLIDHIKEEYEEFKRCKRDNDLVGFNESSHDEDDSFVPPLPPGSPPPLPSDSPSSTKGYVSKLSASSLFTQPPPLPSSMPMASLATPKQERVVSPPNPLASYPHYTGYSPSSIPPMSTQSYIPYQVHPTHMPPASMRSHLMNHPPLPPSPTSTRPLPSPHDRQRFPNEKEEEVDPLLLDETLSNRTGSSVKNYHSVPPPPSLLKK